MARITVPFSGLTSHANHKDGECSNLVNLRPKNGYLKPVPPRKLHHELNKEYSIVFIHRIGDVANWIGVNHMVIYANINSDPIQIGTTKEPVNSIQQIGNTLSFITDNDTYYALWADQAYTYLGTLPPLHDVKFSTDPMVTRGKFYNSEYEGALPYPKTDDERVVFTEKTIGLVKLLLEEEGSKGYFHDAFLIRYAYRLYDGSIIRPSSPILVMPQDHYSEWGKAYLTRTGTSDIYDNDAKVNLKMFKLIAEYSFPADMEKWKDIIKSVDFFTSKYVGLANPDSISNFFMTFPSAGGINIYKQSDKSFGQRHVDHQQRGAGRGPSPSRGGTPIGGSSSSSSHNRQSSDGQRLADPKVEFVDTPEDKVVSASQFYLYYSDDDYLTPKTDANKVKFPNSKVTVKSNFYNIINQEVMPNDTLSHHAIGASTSSVYNNRIRLSDIKTTFYSGHSLTHFQWGSNYNGVPTSESISSKADFIVLVYIKAGQEESILKSNIPLYDLFMNAFISYPDPRAVKLRVLSTSIDGLVFTERLSIELTPHPYLNIAYAINDDLLPLITNVYSTAYLPYGYSYRWHPKITINEPNKLKVSEINNPFVFPNLNTYQIGSGKILNESSIIMNVSDRNYGMYPVFVFTDNGVFTMAGQTSDSVHDSVQAPTYLEPPISDKICATPYGVVFITKRGLMIISQHETKFLSPQLRDDGDNVIFRMPGTNDDPVVDLHDKISPADSITFREFLSTVSDMIYNPYNDELIISSKENEYCYVYDFPTSSYYISTENITGIVQNSFPDIYVLDGKNVKDYSQKHNGTTNISIITRPLHFGTSDIKTLERTILRALLYKVHSITVIAFHSVDGVRFEPAKGRLVMGDDKNYKDIDLGLLARETYPHYVLLISGTIDDESQIRYAEFEIVKRYDNDKMR